MKKSSNQTEIVPPEPTIKTEPRVRKSMNCVFETLRKLMSMSTVRVVFRATHELERTVDYVTLTKENVTETEKRFALGYYQYADEQHSKFLVNINEDESVDRRNHAPPFIVDVICLKKYDNFQAPRDWGDATL